MAKQVKDAIIAVIAPEVPVNDAANPQQSKNLYVTVNTYDIKGKNIGVRVVDMYHYGTRNWLQNHLWWAMHNSAVVEAVQATDQEIDDYMARQTVALAAKFNGPVAALEPVAA